MPTYEYRCETCGDFEESQRITDPPLQRCPKCRRKVRRLISSTSFQLKGSGWYVTDYARGANGGGKKDGGSGASAETKPADAKPADAKPAEAKPAETKPETKPSSAGGGDGSTTS